MSDWLELDNADAAKEQNVTVLRWNCITETLFIIRAVAAAMMACPSLPRRARVLMSEIALRTAISFLQRQFDWQHVKLLEEITNRDYGQRQIDVLP